MRISDWSSDLCSSDLARRSEESGSSLVRLRRSSCGNSWRGAMTDEAIEHTGLAFHRMQEVLDARAEVAVKYQCGDGYQDAEPGVESGRASWRERVCK